LDEQIDKNSGIPTSAKDLTWSYAEVLKALKMRSSVMSKYPKRAGKLMSLLLK